MGTLPTAKKFTYTDLNAQNEKNNLILVNNRLFAQIKELLIAHGFNSVSARARAFARFNTGFYETDMANTHILEITKIILSNNAKDYISNEELKINIDKLSIMKSCLERINYGMQPINILGVLEKSGNNARHTIIYKYKTLPELYSGFYHTFIDADKNYVYNKKIKQQQK